MIIANVTVIPGTGATVSPGVDVDIRDGLFASIQPAARREEQGEVIDGTGKFLIPGLWEAHTHLRPLLQGDQQAALDLALRDYLRHGITSVVDLGGPLEPFAEFRQRTHRDGSQGRAQVMYAGPSFTGLNGWPLPLHHNPAMVHQIGAAT